MAYKVLAIRSLAYECLGGLETRPYAMGGVSPF